MQARLRVTEQTRGESQGQLGVTALPERTDLIANHLVVNTTLRGNEVKDDATTSPLTARIEPWRARVPFLTVRLRCLVTVLCRVGT